MSRTRQLFGTDGIRARAGEYPLDPPTMHALGRALADRLRSNEHAPAVLLGMDTRESGPSIARALSAGLREGGADARFIGVVPTPAVAYLCRRSDAAAGISISASHNPFGDNGVKIFGHDGMKLSDELELAIEDELLEIRDGSRTGFGSDPLEENEGEIEAYRNFLTEGIGPALAGKRVVLDTGHGAAYRIAPEVFRRAGADVVVINDAPDGRNINENAGSLHPETLAAHVVSSKADFGVAFDGDADRAIFVDDAGRVRDGDEILYLWATRDHRQGRLANGVVVATVMSNLGFEKKLEADGIRLLRAAVGDKYVLETMLAEGAELGGEQSGHLIDLKIHTTGDGIHTALVIGRLLAAEPEPFARTRTFEPMPQILINRRVRSKPPLESLPLYAAAAEEAEGRLAGRGRILVRYSGTENLVRVMVEGERDEEIRDVASKLADVLEQEIGSAG
jgi:phosphoglucosamine mutase